MSQGVALHNLLGLVAVNHGLEAVEGAASHDIAHALLLDPKPLDLVVDVKEERVVAG